MSPERRGVFERLKSGEGIAPGLLEKRVKRGEGISPKELEELRSVAGEVQEYKKKEKEADKEGAEALATTRKEYEARREVMERLTERASPEQLWGNVPGSYASDVPPALAKQRLNPPEVRAIVKEQLEARGVSRRLDSARVLAREEFRALRKAKGRRFWKKGFWSPNPVAAERKRLAALSNNVQKLLRGNHLPTHAPVEYGTPRERRNFIQQASAVIFGETPDNRITGEALYELIDHIDAAATYEYGPARRTRAQSNTTPHLPQNAPTPSTAPAERASASPAIAPKPKDLEDLQAFRATAANSGRAGSSAFLQMYGRDGEGIKRKEARAASPADESPDDAEVRYSPEDESFHSYLDVFEDPRVDFPEAAEQYRTARAKYLAGELMLEELGGARAEYDGALYRQKGTELTDDDKRTLYRNMQAELTELQKERARMEQSAAREAARTENPEKRGSSGFRRLLVPLALLATEIGIIEAWQHVTGGAEHQQDTGKTPGDPFLIHRTGQTVRPAPSPEEISPNDLRSSSFRIDPKDPDYAALAEERNAEIHRVHPGGPVPPDAR